VWGGRVSVGGRYRDVLNLQTTSGSSTITEYMPKIISLTEVIVAQSKNGPFGVKNITTYFKIVKIGAREMSKASVINLSSRPGIEVRVSQV
jgi:hypothetical protein